MNDEDDSATAGHYRLPEEAYVALRAVRDQLQLLERLAAPRSPSDDRPDTVLPLTPAMLVQCFGPMARQVGACLDAAQWTRRRRP